MTALGQRIARLVRATGPMSLAEYMHVCMADPTDGYYARRPAIGAAGDFVTSPEISQMFGELIGVWCASVWRAAGRPAPFVLAEAGPGKGTLMADLLRATRGVAGFHDAARVRLVETSDAMAQEQRAALSGIHADIAWRRSIGELDELPLILVANEFLDVLPVRQFVKAGGVWRERCVAAASDDRLSGVLGAAVAGASLLPPGHEDEPEGSVFEHSPAREAWMAELAAMLAARGGAALLVDYGHAYSGFGETFQAMRGHAPADPFAEPGLADLTAHVDFAAAARAAREAGAVASPAVAQGDFLLDMGLAERAGALGANLPPEGQERIRAQAHRLAMPQEMGSLFKVLALASPPWRDRLGAIAPFAAPSPWTGGD